ncbi:21031_t:CDS:2 [Cetraspora pellucida]|uniref:21031_t:CDS:1 n=1 Tax=Cetraspora pellucida TaxID=1433469 RepID=A0A9N9CLA2_9GLOM|nr:21031_t:CDS:2 [Cetraspora pellucida]
MDTVKKHKSTKKSSKNKKRKLSKDESIISKESNSTFEEDKEVNIDDTVLKVTNSDFKDNNAIKKSNIDNLTTYGVENNTLTNTSVDAKKAENSPFRIVTAKMLIDLPPKAFEDFDQGIYTYMNALIMQYVEEFNGIVLAYENIKLCDKSGYIYEDSPYCHFYVQADFVIWDASKGCKLTGKVIRQSPTHIALLLYESFNVKIFRDCIPDDVFEWKDDEEFFNAMISDKQLELDKLYQDGEWFNKQTGESLTDKCIEFEVLGSEVDEGTIFIVGTLQCYSDNPAPERANDVPFDMSALLTFGFSNTQSSSKDDKI